MFLYEKMAIFESDIGVSDESRCYYEVYRGVGGQGDRCDDIPVSKFTIVLVNLLMNSEFSNRIHNSEFTIVVVNLLTGIDANKKVW